jgi:pyruvate/2-oxoacid:ferredoxin oxidoreductase alpha subunit
MQRVPQVLDEAIDEFEQIFLRRPDGAVTAVLADDADTVLIACNTMARTLRGVVRHRRDIGEKIGMIKCKLFRPFPRQAIRDATHSASRIGILDRNHSPGSGGIFWQEIAATLRVRSDLVLQDYIVGLGGGDVTPEVLNHIVDELTNRTEQADPQWEEVAL